MLDEERQLWEVGATECVMVSCCSGAELQLRRGGEIVLRELYPMKSDLYERAAEIKADLLAGSTAAAAETRGSRGDRFDSRASAIRRAPPRSDD